MMISASVVPERLKYGASAGVSRHGAAVDERQQQQHGADDRHLADAARPDEAAVDAHDQRDRDGAEHREGAPRAAYQCLHHDQRQHRKHDDADQQYADAGDARRRPAPSRSGPCRRASGRRAASTGTARSCPARRRRTPRRRGSRACPADSPSAPRARGRPAVPRRRWPRNDGRRARSGWSARNRARHCGDTPASAALRSTPSTLLAMNSA